MVTKALRLATLTSVAAALTGCSQLGIDLMTDKVQYESSTSRAPLEIPPDLNDLPSTERYTIPTRPQIYSANAETAKAELETQKRGEAVSQVLPQTEVATIVRDGAVRYVHVKESADRVWPVLQDFWPSVGLTVKAQDPATGVIQTEWAENKANLPKDIIRRTIGKALDFAYDTSERDQYRSRIERNADGTSNIYITHRQMIEVVTGSQQDSTVWQPGPNDPELEAEMLTRLAQKLEFEFNPTAKPEAQKKLDQMAQAKYVPMSELVADDKGTAQAVVIKEPFDRAWRRVGVALDRAGFDLVDRDRTQGLFMIKYLDPDYELQRKQEQGFFANVFSKTKAVEPVEFQIRLVPNGEQTRLTVTGVGGRADETGVAPRILTLIAEQTR
ncbi:MAG: outer membrane protein assembly factor BamC [Duodenibacillus sp.]|nr:outer membrane protein assembly factor BamC [Duodenibacillus sp.]